MRMTLQRIFTSRALIWLLASLMFISAILFVIGSNLERRSPEASEIGEAHSEAGETSSQAEAGESILGLNLENPWLVGVFTVIWLLLAVLVLRRGQRALILVILMAGATTILDFNEVLFQVGQLRTNITIIAATLGVIHAAIAALAILTLWAHKEASNKIGVRET